MAGTCSHLDQITTREASGDGCVECLQIGGTWVHLRRSASCGHVGCCDSSPNRHATAHVRGTNHPLVQSYEPGEDWYWCYVDEAAFVLDEPLPTPAHP